METPHDECCGGACGDPQPGCCYDNLDHMTLPELRLQYVRLCAERDALKDLVEGVAIHYGAWVEVPQHMPTEPLIEAMSDCRAHVKQPKPAVRAPRIRRK